MTDLLIRDVPIELSRGLRECATHDHRSVQGEVAILLERARRTAAFDAARQFRDELRERNAGRYFRDSTLLIREDRDTGHGKWAFQYSPEEFAQISASIRDRFRGRKFGDSADLTREDRDSDHGHQ